MWLLFSIISAKSCHFIADFFRFLLTFAPAPFRKTVMLPSIYSIKAIEKQYGTGEEPVLVMCSDMNAYVCKYMRSTATTYKLACELIGSHLAKAWQLETPEIVLVRWIAFWLRFQSNGTFLQMSSRGNFYNYLTRLGWKEYGIILWNA